MRCGFESNAQLSTHININCGRNFRSGWLVRDYATVYEARTRLSLSLSYPIYAMFVCVIVIGLKCAGCVLSLAENHPPTLAQRAEELTLSLICLMPEPFYCYYHQATGNFKKHTDKLSTKTKQFLMVYIMSCFIYEIVPHLTLMALIMRIN